MAIDGSQWSSILHNIAKNLDISPTDFTRAMRGYATVKGWLQSGFPDSYPKSMAEPEVFLQGSMRLGTVVRPYRGGKDADFDVDLVCRLQALKESMSPQVVKAQVGGRLRAHAVLRDKLEPEGRRCWTLTYDDEDKSSFHMDVLPCVREDDASIQAIAAYVAKYALTTTAITDREVGRYPEYCWSSGNPDGYAGWFGDRNMPAYARLSESQKRAIFQDNAGLFDRFEDVPDQLVRTPLQRCIQLLKRHRDVRFGERPKVKPISIVITTLAARIYQNETDLFQAFSNIVNALAHHSALTVDPSARIDASIAGMKLIQRLPDGRWYIPNPVNPAENFAEHWHEDNHARAKAFFQWVDWLRLDIMENLARAIAGTDVSAVLAKSFATRVTVVPALASASQVVSRPQVSISSPPIRPWEA